MNKQFTDWKEFKDLTKILSEKILDSNKHYSSLYGIPRGGIFVAQALSHFLDLPLVSEPKKGTLIVDDIVDSGKTILKYKGYDTAVLHYKNHSSSKPSYFVETNNKWIVYPWEINEKEVEGIQDNIVRLLEYIGENPNREGLKETPKRFEKAWSFWTKGYKENPKGVMRVFNNPSLDQLIVIPKIEFYSLCEHHLAPFYGQVHIGYIPNKKVLGLSKFARLTEIYARRLQIQERLTKQIADDITNYLKPQGVGVVVRGIHLCMRSRGVEKQNSEMVTSVMVGEFRKNSSLRHEFLSLIK